MSTPTPYPWMEDSQYVTSPVVTGYLAVTSPNGLYLSNGSSTTTITPTDVSSTIFNGDLDGNAGTATTATNANNVAIADDNTNSTFYPVFVSNNTGNLPLKVDRTTNPLSYNPSSGTLTTTTFVGALTGNASTATRATNIAGGLGGQIPYQTAVNTTALLANGTAGQVLTSGGTTVAPSWGGYTARITATSVTSGHSFVDYFQNGLQYRCHRFLTASAYTLTVSAISANASFDFCIIGGGGGGANQAGSGGGGGGSGALICAFNVPFTTLGNITGTVGDGGAAGVSGGNTTIVLPAPGSQTITASGGGAGVGAGTGVAGGQGYTQLYTSPFSLTLGSSGGGGAASGAGGAAVGATLSFPKTSFSDLIFGGGRAGGTGASTAGGGGGGNGGTGTSAAGTAGGAGGTGFNLYFDNTLRLVCGGGGGGGTTAGTATFGGGAGGTGAGAGTAGTANSGGGGGGGGTTSTSGGRGGGSGLVMIRYVIG